MDYGAPLHCQNCGTLNDPRNNLTGVPACASCGLTSVEGAFTTADELSKLFERGMTFAQPQLPSVAQHQEQHQQQSPSPEVRPVLGYSASQHYIPVTRPVLSPEPEIETQSDRLPLACEQLLEQHGISAHALSAAQKSLFLYASPEQRARLLDLWAAYSQIQGRDFEMESSMEHQLGPSAQRDHDSAEPYIMSGYELQGASEGQGQAKDTFSPFGTAVGNGNEYKQSTDPVFQGASQGWWRHGDGGGVEQAQQPMEHQYGMFEAMRQYHVPIDDDEML